MREVKAMESMSYLADIGHEEEFKQILAEEFGVKPGHPRYENAMATWREIQCGKT
jgi:hypothetical protein